MAILPSSFAEGADRGQARYRVAARKHGHRVAQLLLQTFRSHIGAYAAQPRRKGRMSPRASDLVERGLVASDRAEELRRVAERFSVAITDDIAALIDPADPADPISAQFVPDAAELNDSTGDLADPVGAARHSPVPGIVHRYPDRVLLKPILI